MDDLTRRALAAYFDRSGTGSGWPEPGWPTRSSGPQEHDGRQHIVIKDGQEILAVYRLRNDGQLKRLRRWPRALNKLEGSS